MANVFVGLSGGVDSAVSAALLKEQGHDVTGAFIRIYRPEFIECTWKEDRLDAMRVCAALSIPFREIDLSDEYKREVVDTMIADYKRGITPNPDVLCNRAIKFGGFLSWVRSQGAAKIATGHYAQIKATDGAFELHRGADPNKDQSYFLYRLKQDDLRRTLFPVGEMEKTKVRAKAAELKLPVAGKHDSQGLCFIGDVSIADFLKRYVDIESGPVVDVHGAVIGEHAGAALLTVGQRHGFTLLPGTPQIPHYVVSIDASANTVVVSPRKEDAATAECALRDVSWVAEPSRDSTRVLVQARYRETPAGAMLRVNRQETHKSDLWVEFDEPQIAPPGQSLVIYLPPQAGRESTVLGGGVIENRG